MNLLNFKSFSNGLHYCPVHMSIEIGGKHTKNCLNESVPVQAYGVARAGQPNQLYNLTVVS